MVSFFQDVWKQFRSQEGNVQLYFGSRFTLGWCKHQEANYQTYNSSWDEVTHVHRILVLHETRLNRIVTNAPCFESNPVPLPDLYFHWSLLPVACFVIRARGIVCVVSSIVSFSNDRPRLESYRVSLFWPWPCLRIVWALLCVYVHGLHSLLCLFSGKKNRALVSKVKINFPTLLHSVTWTWCFYRRFTCCMELYLKWFVVAGMSMTGLHAKGCKYCSLFLFLVTRHLSIFWVPKCLSSLRVLWVLIHQILNQVIAKICMILSIFYVTQ